jgi:predicted ATP-grasp superfamily ATP-dependent carboligase
MREIIVTYLKVLGFHGLFQLEFKVDSHDHISKLIDVNARSWGGGAISNTLPSACGVNVILIAYLDAIENIAERTKVYEDHIFGINLLLDGASSLTMLLQKKATLSELIFPYRGKKHWAVMAKDDWKPFPIYIQKTLRLALNKIKSVF